MPGEVPVMTAIAATRKTSSPQLGFIKFCQGVLAGPPAPVQQHKGPWRPPPHMPGAPLMKDAPAHVISAF